MLSQFWSLDLSEVHLSLGNLRSYKVPAAQLEVHVASSPDLPRLLIAASDLKEGRPCRFWYVTLRQVDTNVTSCQPTVSQPNSWNIAGSRD